MSKKFLFLVFGTKVAHIYIHRIEWINQQIRHIPWCRPHSSSLSFPKVIVMEGALHLSTNLPSGRCKVPSPILALKLWSMMTNENPMLCTNTSCHEVHSVVGLMEDRGYIRKLYSRLNFVGIKLCLSINYRNFNWFQDTMEYYLYNRYRESWESMLHTNKPKIFLINKTTFVIFSSLVSFRSQNVINENLKLRFTTSHCSKAHLDL